MKVKDLIAQLQDCNPEAHIRMPSGILFFAEEKPGYYDGPFDYIDEKGMLVKSIVGSKVDIHTLEYMDHAEKIAKEYYLNNGEYFLPSFDTFFERHCRHELGSYSVEHIAQRVDNFKKAYKSDFDMWVNIQSRYSIIYLDGVEIDNTHQT